MIPKGLSDIEKKYYLGSVSQSLEHIPQWYQIFSLSSVVFILYCRRSSLVTWLAYQLHASFGTSEIWEPEYREVLESMTFNERFCFTLYGVGLGAVVALLFTFFCLDRFSFGSQVTQMFPDKKAPLPILTVLIFISEAFSLQCLATMVIGDKDSAAHLALTDFDMYSRIHSPPVNNVHFAIQVELLKAILSRFVKRRVPVVIMGAVYRFVRDVPRKEHCALRWYLATVFRFAIALDIILIFVFQSVDLPSLSSLAFSLLYLGLVNYIYGPLKRAGMIVTASTSNSIKELMKGTLTCAALLLISTLMVLTVVVSVHVVELILTWLVASLLLVWTPAIIDSCSVEYIVFISIGFAVCATQMNYLDTFKEGTLFVAMSSILLLDLCLVYNNIINVSKNRYIAVAITCYLLLSFLSPSKEERDLGSPSAATHPSTGEEVVGGLFIGVVDLLSYRVRSIISLIKGEQLPSDSNFAQLSTSSETAYKECFGYASAITVMCLVVNCIVQKFQSEETKSYLLLMNILLVTPNVLFRKVIHTFVLVVIVGTSYLCGFAFWRHFVFPRLTFLNTFLFIPEMFYNLASFCMFCVVLGTLMDVRKTMYDGCLRVFAIINPPSNNDESSDYDKED